MKKIISILILSVLILPLNVLAGVAVTNSIENPINAASFTVIIESITNFIFSIGLVAAPLMVVIAGLLIITAGGDPKKVELGRHIIVYTLIGLFIILFAKGIISILNKALGVTT